MTNQRLQEIAMGLLGADAIAWDAADVEANEWIVQFLRTRANSIEGGTVKFNAILLANGFLDYHENLTPTTVLHGETCLEADRSGRLRGGVLGPRS